MRGPQTGLLAILNSKQREGGGNWAVGVGLATRRGDGGRHSGQDAGRCLRGGQARRLFFLWSSCSSYCFFVRDFRHPTLFALGPRMAPATQIATSCLVCRGGANTKRCGPIKKWRTLCLVSKKNGEASATAPNFLGQALWVWARAAHLLAFGPSRIF